MKIKFYQLKKFDSAQKLFTPEQKKWEDDYRIFHKIGSNQSVIICLYTRLRQIPFWRISGSFDFDVMHVDTCYVPQHVSWRAMRHIRSMWTALWKRLLLIFWLTRVNTSYGVLTRHVTWRANATDSGFLGSVNRVQVGVPANYR